MRPAGQSRNLGRVYTIHVQVVVGRLLLFLQVLFSCRLQSGSRGPASFLLSPLTRSSVASNTHVEHGLVQTVRQPIDGYPGSGRQAGGAFGSAFELHVSFTLFIQ